MYIFCLLNFFFLINFLLIKFSAIKLDKKEKMITFSDFLLFFFHNDKLINDFNYFFSRTIDSSARILLINLKRRWVSHKIKRKKRFLKMTFCWFLKATRSQQKSTPQKQPQQQQTPISKAKPSTAVNAPNVFTFASSSSNNVNKPNEANAVKQLSDLKINQTMTTSQTSNSGDSSNVKR